MIASKSSDSSRSQALLKSSAKHLENQAKTSVPRSVEWKSLGIPGRILTGVIGLVTIAPSIRRLLGGLVQNPPRRAGRSRVLGDRATPLAKSYLNDEMRQADSLIISGGVEPERGEEWSVPWPNTVRQRVRAMRAGASLATVDSSSIPDDTVAFHRFAQVD